MQVAQQVRERFTAAAIPPQAYALVGASLRAGRQAEVLGGRASAAAQAATSAVNTWVTTALQAGTVARERAESLPGGTLAAARRAPAAPAEARAALARVRGLLADHYGSLADEGERAVARWHAERVLNDRADRMTRSFTPAAARATVSARDAARRAAASPTGQRLGETGRRVRAGAGRAWQDYLTAVDESGAVQWGDAAMNNAAAVSHPR